MRLQERAALLLGRGFRRAALNALPLFGRQVVQLHAPRELERAYVGDDLPTVFRRNLLGVGRHCAPAVRYHVEEVRGGRHVLLKPVLIIRGRLAEAAAHDHAVALAGRAVTDDAVDVESLAPATERRLVNREREDIRPARGRGLARARNAARRVAEHVHARARERVLSARRKARRGRAHAARLCGRLRAAARKLLGLARKEIVVAVAVLAPELTRHSPFDGRAHRSAVGEELPVARAERLVLRLILHVHAATEGQKAEGRKQETAEEDGETWRRGDGE